MVDVEEINEIFAKITEEFQDPVPIGGRCESRIYYRTEDLTDEDKLRIQEIIVLASEIDLWAIDLPPIPKTNVDIQYAAQLNLKLLIYSDSPKETVIKLFLIPTYDFEREILSYGERVRIIEPLNFRKKMRNEVQNMLRKLN